jgi:hypothetical protein
MKVEFLTQVALELASAEEIPRTPRQLSIALRRVEDLVDGQDEPVKLLAFHRQLLAAGHGERVVPSPPVVLGRASFGFDPPCFRRTTMGECATAPPGVLAQ